MRTSMGGRGGREFTDGEIGPGSSTRVRHPAITPRTGDSLSHNPHMANKALGQHPRL
ncbi:hypothetical protein GCM10027074_44940 [Streptomyces deserti]